MGNNIDDTLADILGTDLDVDLTNVTESTRLIDDLGLDSLAFAIGAVALEERLGVVLNEEDLISCDTVGDLHQLVVSKAQPAR